MWHELRFVRQLSGDEKRHQQRRVSPELLPRLYSPRQALPVYEESAEEGKSILLKQHNLKTLVGGRPHFTYKKNMGWNLFGVPYLCSYTTERMSIDHILYTYDPEASRFVSINSWEGNTIAPFSAVFTQTATVKESEELLFAKLLKIVVVSL